LEGLSGIGSLDLSKWVVRTWRNILLGFISYSGGGWTTFWDVSSLFFFIGTKIGRSANKSYIIFISNFIIASKILNRIVL
jgi:hypothetical protein